MTATGTSLLPVPDKRAPSPFLFLSDEDSAATDAIAIPLAAFRDSVAAVITAHEPAEHRQPLRLVLARETSGHPVPSSISGTAALRACVSVLRAFRLHCGAPRAEWEALRDQLAAALAAVEDGRPLTPPPDEPALGTWTQHCGSCGKPYQAARASSRYCGDTCRVNGLRSRRKADGLRRDGKEATAGK